MGEKKNHKFYKLCISGVTNSMRVLCIDISSIDPDKNHRGTIPGIEYAIYF